MLLRLHTLLMARFMANPKPMKPYPTTIAGNGAAARRGINPIPMQILAMKVVLALPNRRRTMSTKGAAAMYPNALLMKMSEITAYPML